MGGLDISDDGRYLYVVNLYDRKLYELDLTNAANPVPPTAAKVRSWQIPTTGCTNGDARPWASKFYRGKIYVGVVCSGENGGTTNNLAASVLEINPKAATPTFTTTVPFSSIPLNFTRGLISKADFRINAWYPWTNTYVDEIRPEPILSDIEFDNDGSMILGFTDRLGNKAGFYNKKLTGNDLTLTVTGGDILRLYKTTNASCGWELETNGKEGVSSPKAATTGDNNNQGPGGGEFYWADWGIRIMG